ncbi:hypothetical protein HMPREF1981_01324, partial [Bacteroides pyogenes F0041]
FGKKLPKYCKNKADSKKAVWKCLIAFAFFGVSFQFAKVKEILVPNIRQIALLFYEIIRLSVVFYSSAVRETNKTQSTDVWNTNGRRITFIVKTLNHCNKKAKPLL